MINLWEKKMKTEEEKEDVKIYPCKLVRMFIISDVF